MFGSAIFVSHLDSRESLKLQKNVPVLLLRGQWGEGVHTEEGRSAWEANIIRTSGPFLSRRQVLQTQDHHQEEIWSAAHTTSQTSHVILINQSPATDPVHHLT